MCGPVALGAAVAAVGAASAITSHVGANQAYAANKQAATYNYANDLEAIGAKTVELDQERSNNAFDTAIATAREQGRISASASDMGLGSPSIVGQLNAGMFGIGRQAEAEALNDQNARRQLAADKTGADIRRQTQVNSRSRSSGLQLALGIGQSAISGGTTYAAAR